MMMSFIRFYFLTIIFLILQSANIGCGRVGEQRSGEKKPGGKPPRGCNIEVHLKEYAFEDAKKQIKNNWKKIEADNRSSKNLVELVKSNLPKLKKVCGKSYMIFELDNEFILYHVLDRNGEHWWVGVNGFTPETKYGPEVSLPTSPCFIHSPELLDSGRMPLDWATYYWAPMAKELDKILKK